MGSFVTWTTISCPSLSRSSMRAPPPRARARRPRPPLRHRVVAVRLGRQQPLEVVGRAAHVGDVQVGALLEADVDEGGLHPGQHALDAALVDVAGDPAFALALDVELAEVPVFDERDPGLRTVGIDYQEAMRHGHASGQAIEKITEPSRRRHADANVRVHHGIRGGRSALVTRNRRQFNDIASATRVGTRLAVIWDQEARTAPDSLTRLELPLLPSHRRKPV